MLASIPAPAKPAAATTAAGRNAMGRVLCADKPAGKIVQDLIPAAPVLRPATECFAAMMTVVASHAWASV